MTEHERRQIFEQWLGMHKALIFKVVRAYAFTAMDQDDLFQEIIIQVWNSVPGFRKESAVTTWLYRVSLNTAIKWTARERKHDTAREGLDKAAHVLQANNVQKNERLEWLYGEISRMDEIDRSITLLMLEGFSYREMAGMTGISESNIGVRINRVKKYLINRSKKYDYHGI